MALDVTINLNDALEAELVAETNESNRMPGQTQLTPSQFLRRKVRDELELAASQRADAERLGLRSAYKLATPTEQATINGILDKYR